MLEVSPILPSTPRRSTIRDPWTEDEARAALAAVGQSGLSLAAFARRHGLCDRQLYWWRSRLRTHPSVEPATRPFVRIRTHALPSRDSSGVEIVIPDAIIRVAPGFCPETLARAVAALRPC